MTRGSSIAPTVLVVGALLGACSGDGAVGAAAADTLATPETGATIDTETTKDASPDTSIDDSGSPTAADGVDAEDTADLDANDTATDIADAAYAADTADTADIVDNVEAPDIADSPDGADTPEIADTSDAPKIWTIAEFEALVATASESSLGAFLAEYDMPICEAGTCLFVTDQPGAATVELMGAWDGWKSPSAMKPLPFAPGVFSGKVQASFGAPGQTPIEYKLKVDGAWKLDESCRYFRFGGFGPNSAIYAPGKGRLAMIAKLYSPQLSNERDLFVRLPWAYFTSKTTPFPVLYMQDGFNVFENPKAAFGTWNVELTADALETTGEIEPVIIVGIDTHDRLAEYVWTPIEVDGESYGPKLPQYGAMVVETVKPKIDAAFRTKPERESTAISGSSLGGVSALWIAWKHSAVFGSVAALSSSLWIGEEGGSEPGGSAGGPSLRSMVQENAEGVTPSKLRVYLDCGDSDFDGAASYVADSWVYTDWMRNALVTQGWPNRAEWDTDANLATPPADLPATTPVAKVPALAWAPAPPATYTGWKDYLGTTGALVALVGHGHPHNEGAWQKRFGAVLRFVRPGPALD